jgi:CHASE2 domain-containing sensor protein/tRNA A-37 threonylcarbamoyl transferase component Bud32
MKTRFWSSDWFTGLLITIVVVIFSGAAPFQSLEQAFYDWGVRSTERSPAEKIAVIAIDDESISNLGRWPWPRNLHAELINRLSEGGAKIIGQTVLFLEPQVDPGMIYIRELIDFFSNASFNDVPADIDTLGAMLEFEGKSPSVAEILEFYLQSSVNTRLSQDIETLKSGLFEAEQSLDTDARLAESMANASNVVIPMLFLPGKPRGNPDEELPDYVLKNSINQIRDRVSAQSAGFFPIQTVNAIPPIPDVGQYASAIGHLISFRDEADGGLRSEPLVLYYYDRFFPSISLQIAAKSLNLDTSDIRVNLAESVELGSLKIKTDRELKMNTFYYSDREGEPAFQADSFFDVFSGKIPIEKYRDKIVLIGPTATGVGTPQVTPINPSMAPVLILAHSVSSILNEDFFIEPEWGFWARMATFLVVMLYLMLLMPRLKAGVAFVITLVLLMGLVASHYVLMTNHTMWIQLMTPGALLAIGYLLITTKRFLVSERGKARSDEESAESNRMLGIAFQTQGQLDMAFEKFRKCSPVDDQVLEAMYNLALDFERKRQFNKATSVYQYMSGQDRNFRDIETRMNRAQKMEETIMLGGSNAAGTLVLEQGGIEKPMLGRYEVEKELGKGAMGTVYLGKDPKISRVVAIKTMALAQEFDEDEIDEVKKRFFREAETAGRLNHPNIVTIYDAGEEHDLAFIAMEFLKGHDLTRYCKPDNLMDMRRVISIVARSAEGLDFAHKQNVVHRDIKPANIMYEVESDTLKITVFGIARITDSSKTKTGTVLGTPSYMSPEQLAGKKVDGRADLFSLGIMLYQMLSGSLPFKADSMASLMFKITNEEAADIRTIRAEIPEALATVVNKALIKDVDHRYQTGIEFANALKVFLKT